MGEEQPPLPEYHRGRHPGDIYLRRPRLVTAGLHRVLGVPGLFSAAYGNVGSSIYYALGVTAAFTLGLTPLVFIFSGILFGFTALTYAEGTTAMPEAGGSGAFARRAFNEMVSFVAAWALMLDYIVTIAISGFSVPNYLAVFYEPLKEWPTNALFGVGVVALLAWVNVIGVKESTAINTFLAVLDLLTQIILVAFGVMLVLSPDTLVSNVHLGTAPTWGQLLFGISISMIAYTGIETVSNLAEETRNPAKNIPRSVIGVFISVISLYTLISVVALSAMPVKEVGGEFITDLGEKYREDPVLGIVHTLDLPGALDTLMAGWVGILAATILFIATNAGMLGLSRLAYSMGYHHQLPRFISQLHPKRRTPANAVIIFAVLASLLILPGRVTLLADLYSFGAMLAFTFAHLSIIVLRWKEPDMERPFRIPVNVRIRGREIPTPAVLGVMGTFSTWVVVVATHQFGRAIGAAWLVGGLIMYLAYRRSIGLSPMTSTPPTPVVKVR